MISLPAHDVSIRPYGPDDLPLLERLLGDPAMTVHLGGPESPEALVARHQRYLALDRASGAVFTVLVGPERVAAGWVGYWESEWLGEKVWECGWHVLTEHQGRGVATKAMALVLDEIRARSTYRYVHAFPSVDNAASNALCRRLGFELLGEEDVEYPRGRTMRSNNWRSSSKYMEHHYVAGGSEGLPSLAKQGLVDMWVRSRGAGLTSRIMGPPDPIVALKSIAKVEGDEESRTLFEQVLQDERSHSETFRSLLEGRRG